MSTKRTLSMANLNPDLLTIICSHLLYKEQLKFISVNQPIREISKSFRYMRLKENFALQFYEDITFRNKCLSLIKNASRQLHLTLSLCDQLTDVSALSHVHSLDLSIVVSLQM
jgi:hypothetical protein